MVMDRSSLFGESKNEGTAKIAVLSFNKEVRQEKINSGDKQMKKYKVLINNFVEKGVVHSKDSILQVEVAEDRATNLINAGYIEEVVAAAPVVEKKVIEAETKKVITADQTEKKDATGIGANLLKKKGKK